MRTLRPAVAAPLLALLALVGGCAPGAGPGGAQAPPPSVPTTAPPASAAPASRGPATSAPASSGARPGETDGTAPMPVVAHGPRTAKRVALTFDADMTPYMRGRLRDGSVASYYNADVISTLRDLDVPATLFLAGLWVETYPDVTRELAGDDLFELGTHSWSHRAFTADCYGLASVPADEMLAEVTDAVELLDTLDPEATRWFRFPGGCHDDAALRRTGPAGVTAVGTDVSAGDGGAASAGAIVATVLAAVRPGSIVTMHMHGGLAPLTDEAVALLVPALRDRGYELVSVTDLLAG